MAIRSCPRGCNRPIAPFMCGEVNPFIVDDHDRVEFDEAEHSRRPPAGAVGAHQQSVVPPGSESCNRAHRIATEAIGHEPLAAARLVERATHLSTERDPQLVHVARHCSEDITSGSGRQIRSATSPVQPVLVGGAQSCTVVAVEVLVEGDVVAPARVVLQPVDPAVARSATLSGPRRNRPINRRRRSSAHSRQREHRPAAARVLECEVGTEGKGVALQVAHDRGS